MKFRLNFFSLFYWTFFTIVLFSNFVTLYAQQNKEVKPIVINSWQKGDGMINEKSLKLKLVSDEFNLDVYDTNQKRQFRLQVEKIFVPTVRKPNPQCVSLSLKELFEDKTTRGNLLGSNLFLLGNSLETSAHIICPIEKPLKALDGGIYSINADRIFNIENFIVTVKMSNYDYNANDNRLSNIELIINFRNRQSIAPTKK